MPFWKLYYHIVWATAGRQPMISSDIEQLVFKAIKDKVYALGGTVSEINGTMDHVHVAGCIPPSISISKFVGEIKGSSSFHINHLPDNPQPIDWQKGFGVVSFRKDNLEQVVAYIRNQKEHHASGKIWSSLEDCGDDEVIKPDCVREEGADPYS